MQPWVPVAAGYPNSKRKPMLLIMSARRLNEWGSFAARGLRPSSTVDVVLLNCAVARCPMHDAAVAPDARPMRTDCSSSLVRIRAAWARRRGPGASSPAGEAGNIER